MPTRWSPHLCAFSPVAGRRVRAAFEGGAVTTAEAGALLSGAADRALRLLVERFAAGFPSPTAARRIGSSIASRRWPAGACSRQRARPRGPG
jgi:hypothetical protein